jgi:CheY-like chemotaxis protein
MKDVGQEADEQDPWRFLYVEDNAELARQVKELFETGRPCGPVTVGVVDSFDSARVEVESRRYDLLILDVFAGKPSLDSDRAGVDVLDHLKRVRFVPTIFYTALPAAVGDPISPFVKVVAKEGVGFEPLVEAAKSFIASGLMSLNRGLTGHVDRIYLDYMEQFVGAHWAAFAALPDKRALAYLVARRLAMSLSSERIADLAQALGEPSMSGERTALAGTRDGSVHPMQYYVMPPVSGDFLAGDIVEAQINGHTGHWALLTPSCDMVTRDKVKADYVHVARCLLLSEQPEYREWQAADNRTTRGVLEALLRNNRRNTQAGRYHYLPGVFELPHLIADFQQVEHVPHSTLCELRDRGDLKRIASLDSPFAESLLSRYNLYMSRLGTPDLDIDSVLENLGKKPRLDT